MIHETDIFFWWLVWGVCRQKMFQLKMSVEVFPQPIVNDLMQHTLRNTADLEMQEKRMGLMLRLSMIL